MRVGLGIALLVSLVWSWRGRISRGAAFAMLVVLSGCTTPQMPDKECRTDQLRRVYPASITSRADVQAKFLTEPTLSAERPEAGWQHHPDALLSRRLPPLEANTNKEIALVERHLAPDPRSSFDFYSLCSVWFYYDVEAKVVDVEWEWHTD